MSWSAVLLLFACLIAVPSCESEADGGETDLQTELDVFFTDDVADQGVGGDVPDQGPPTDTELDSAAVLDSGAQTDVTMDSVQPLEDTVADVPGTDEPPELSNTCNAPASAAVENAALPVDFCASIWASGLSQPRGIAVADNGDVLVVERSRQRVTALYDLDQDGLSEAGERTALAEASGLNHGIAINDGFLYASSPTTVYRWPYTPGDRQDLGGPQIVVTDIPGGGHSTRTLIFDGEGRLYVTVGSGGNVDGDSHRARIRRFDPEVLDDGGVTFGAGVIHADGLRNTVGLGLDPEGRLWGVNNGSDNLFRADLGGDIHHDNPAEELNLFDEEGAHYGYPYCWTEFLLPEGVGGGAGTLWAHGNFIDDGTHTDTWCRDPANSRPPELAMQGHSAPLDVTFYSGSSFPRSAVGDAFISFHGSWNRDVPTGYKVVRVVFEGGAPTAVEPFFEYGGAGDIGGAWPHRPVGIGQGAQGQLFVTSDASDVVIVIGYAR